MKITKIGILGAGTMGHGIAQVAALSGFSVCIKDATDERTKKGIGMIEKNLGRLLEKAKLTQEQVESLLLEGLASGESVEMTQSDWDDLRQVVQTVRADK